MSELTEHLHSLDAQLEKIQVERMLALQKAAASDDPDAILTAQKTIEKMSKKNQLTPPKAFFIDPLQFNANLGFKDKSFSLSYTTLKKMSRVPIINSIIKTRKNQIADFAEPQNDRYSNGFIIRKKARMGVEQKMTEKDKKIANAITDFILGCGNKSNWISDDFDTFIRKIVDDSLTYDQMTFECIRNRKGGLEGFVATDAATFRMAESAFREEYDNSFFHRRGAGFWGSENLRKEFVPINGYYPQYVQVYQSAVVNEFYPWELCFGIRNPSTSIYANGYGCSELEELINVVTAMLWGDEYNRRFFSQGSAPKGLLRIKTTNGNSVNEAALQQFKQQWQAMISGVMQSWKTPVVEADVDWIDLQKNNRDMEYASWMEYLIKLACAIYSIDPTEIGWDISRSGGNGGLFEGNQAERLQHSKDKGLYPMLKFIQRKINKYIIEPLNPEFEFLFMGLNGMTIEKELEMDIKKLGSFMTLNEIRQKWDLDPFDEEMAGEVVENSYWLQAKSQAAQQQQQPGMGGMMGDGGYNEDDYDNGEGYEEESAEDEDVPFELYDEDDEPNSTENEGKDSTEDTEGSDEDVYESEDEDKETKTRKKAYSDTFIKAFDEFMNKSEQEI